MNRGKVKIKRKRLGEFATNVNPQKSPRGSRPNKVVIRNAGSSNKAKNSRVRTKIQGRFKNFESAIGLRSDPKRARVSNRLRAEQQQQRSRKMDGNRRPTETRERIKLFTKDFDARKRIEAKRKMGKERSANKGKESSKMVLQKSREQQKTANLSKMRGFSMVGDQMKIVSRVEMEKERETTFTGTSLRVTTLQTSPERLQHRETSQSGNSLLITTEGKSDNVVGTEVETSEYGLFEARRKAKQAAKAQVEQDPPKLSSLNPISRPKRPPLFEYEDITSFGNSSKILVSNLHPNVSQDDILELFSAIGSIKSARVIRQGVAEVIYHTHQDAVNAYKKYHSRNLDGQPMLCKLVATEQPMYAPPSARQPRGGAVTSSSPVVFTVKI